MGGRERDFLFICMCALSMQHTNLCLWFGCMLSTVFYRDLLVHKAQRERKENRAEEDHRGKM